MTASLDTSCLLALHPRDRFHRVVTLELARRQVRRQQLIISPLVHAEALGGGHTHPTDLDRFLKENEIELVRDMPHQLYLRAGDAFRAYLASHPGSQRKERRLLADFLIAAHARAFSDELLTLDPGLYGLGHPALRVVDLRLPEPPAETPAGASVF